MGNQLAAGQIDEATYDGKIGALLGNPKANIQMVILENNHSAQTFRQADVIQAFKSVKYVVSVTEDFTKPSSMYADILIPEAYAQFESRQPRSGNQGVSGFFAVLLFRNDGNLWFYMQKCVDPPGEVVAQDYFWLQVARQSGQISRQNPGRCLPT